MVNKKRKEFKPLEPREIKDKVMNFFESQRLEPESIYYICKQVMEECWEKIRINEEEDLENYFYDDDDLVDDEGEEDFEEDDDDVETIDFEVEEPKKTRQQPSKGVKLSKPNIKPQEEEIIDEVLQDQEEEEDIDSFEDLMNDIDEENSVAEQEEEYLEDEEPIPKPKKKLLSNPLPSLKNKKSNMVSK